MDDVPLLHTCLDPSEGGRTMRGVSYTQDPEAVGPDRSSSKACFMMGLVFLAAVLILVALGVGLVLLVGLAL